MVERQRDRSTRDPKLVVRGKALDGAGAETVVKLGASGKIFVITVYRI